MITIGLLKKKIDNNARLIGLDLGSKRIGVAICDDKRKISTPFKTIDYRNMQYLLDQLTNIIYENNISGIIIGFPINMDGSLGKAAQSVKDKASIISEKLKMDVVLWDERMSTKGAFNISKELDVNVTNRVKKIDENAASFILQGAIDYLNN
tara:strand:- start:248 stop:703 length:456 start_codon:yes stop_codon:yes gene_type:complete